MPAPSQTQAEFNECWVSTPDHVQPQDEAPTIAAQLKADKGRKATLVEDRRKANRARACGTRANASPAALLVQQMREEEHAALAAQTRLEKQARHAMRTSSVEEAAQLQKASEVGSRTALALAGCAIPIRGMLSCPIWALQEMAVSNAALAEKIAAAALASDATMVRLLEMSAMMDERSAQLTALKHERDELINQLRACGKTVRLAGGSEGGGDGGDQEMSEPDRRTLAELQASQHSTQDMLDAILERQAAGSERRRLLEMEQEGLAELMSSLRLPSLEGSAETGAAVATETSADCEPALTVARVGFRLVLSEELQPTFPVVGHGEAAVAAETAGTAAELAAATAKIVELKPKLDATRAEAEAEGGEEAAKAAAVSLLAEQQAELIALEKTAAEATAKLESLEVAAATDGGRAAGAAAAAAVGSAGGGLAQPCATAGRVARELMVAVEVEGVEGVDGVLGLLREALDLRDEEFAEVMIANDESLGDSGLPTAVLTLKELQRQPRTVIRARRHGTEGWETVGAARAATPTMEDIEEELAAVDAQSEAIEAAHSVAISAVQQASAAAEAAAAMVIGMQDLSSRLGGGGSGGLPSSAGWLARGFSLSAGSSVGVGLRFNPSAGSNVFSEPSPPTSAAAFGSVGSLELKGLPVSWEVSKEGHSPRTSALPSPLPPRTVSRPRP